MSDLAPARLKVELLFFEGCPHAENARMNLASALGGLDLDPVWVEWERDDVNAPAYARLYGSPTVLVDGKDVTGGAPGPDAPHCRAGGAPGREEIVEAIKAGRAVNE